MNKKKPFRRDGVSDLPDEPHRSPSMILFKNMQQNIFAKRLTYNTTILLKFNELIHLCLNSF